MADEYVICTRCNGVGSYTRGGTASSKVTCTKCRGSGKLWNTRNYLVRARLQEEAREAQALKTRELSKKQALVWQHCLNPACRREHGHSQFSGYCSSACYENCRPSQKAKT